MIRLRRSCARRVGVRECIADTMKVARALLWAALLIGANAFAADPQIAQWTDNPDPVPAGGLVTYSARIDNSSLDDALSVVVSVPVPSGATFVSATAPCALAAGTVTCSLGTVGGNGNDPRLLDFVFRANGPGPSSITAVATLTSSNDTNTSNNVQSQTTTVISGGNLALTKTGAPDPVIGGANVTYTLTASNAGPNISGDIVITDNLPPSTSFVSSSGSGWSCSVSGQVVTCTHPGPHAVNAAIPALTLVAKVNAAGGTITNSATVAPAASGGTADPDTSDNTATVNTNVTPGADLRTSKSVTSATPAIANQNVTFLVQPRNAGPSPATNAVVTDNLPAGWTFVSATGPNWTCANAGLVVTCTRAAFAVNTTDDITIVAKAPVTAAVGPTGTTYTNTATTTSATADPDHSNDTGTVNVLVLPDGADLRISKTKTPNPVALGSTLTSTIGVTNNGPRVATGPLRVVEVLSGETYVSASGSGWTCVATGNTIVCTNTNVGGLAVGSTLPSLVILSTATSAGAATNNACTGSSVPAGAAGGTTASPPVETDPNTANDCVSVTSNSTTTQPDLAITKVTSTPTGGDKIVSTTEGSVTYTLVARNATTPGTDAATGVVITDTVPAYVTGATTIDPVTATVSAGTATFGCATSGATVTCTQSGGQLLPGQTVTVPIKVNRPLFDGTFTNTATVGNTVEGDPNASNNSASDTVTIAPIADIEVTGKTVTPSAVRAGEQATYVISYRNNGPSPALNVNLTDVFTFAGGDTGATVLAFTTSKPGSTCSIAAGAVLAPSTNSYSCVIGTLANGETQSITLVVRPNFQPGNAARTFANTASITTTTVENPAGGDNGNNSKSATLPVNPALVDLLTNKTDLEDPVPFSGNAFLNYRVTVTNNGPSFATGVKFTDTMTPPAGRRIRFVCDTNGPSSATCNAPALCSVASVTSAPGVALAPFTCAVPAGTSVTGPAQGELATTQSKVVFLRFEVLDAPTASGDTYNNVATSSANEPDSFAGNDTATEQTTVRQRIDLAVTKTSSATTVTLKQPFTWTVTVTNNGPGNSLQTDVSDVLPAGVSVTGAIAFTKTSPAGNGTCTVAAGTVNCSLGVLNNGGVATITLPARVDSYPGSGSLTNTATVDTTPSKIGGIDPVTANNTATSPVLNVTRSSLAGTVFQDRDRNGANAGTPQSAAVEPRIPGVTVTLSGSDVYGNAVSLTTTTDASGNYLFDNLAPSSAAGYLVTETQPSGFVNSPSAPPTSGAQAPTAGGTYAAGGTAGNSSFSAVVLPAGTAATNYNFPELAQLSLSGFVYVDSNGNGVRDPSSDLPIPNATVRLLNAANGTVVASTTTDAAGAYSFQGLDSAIVYTLEEPLPAGLINGPVNVGLINGAACASGCTAQPNTPSAGTDRIASIDLSSGNGTQFNFGELQPPSTAITGSVYVDRNRNGALDPTPTDDRLYNVTVRLVQGATCATGTTVQTTVTAADGRYSLTGGIAGQSYLICETQPVGYGQGSNTPGTGATAGPAVDTIAIASLAATGSSGNNFGELVGSVAGYVFLDANNDGARTGDVGIPGVAVTLTGVDVRGTPVNVTTVSDASGAYRFDDVLPPNAAGYTITEQAAQPVVNGNATLNGKTTAGTSGGQGTPPSTPQSAITGIGLGAGADSIENNFGEIVAASIAGTVFLDLNNNGIQNLPGDVGLAGVTITLDGTDDLGATVTRTTTTAGGGSYRFANLRPGTYAVREPTQPTGTANGITVAGTSGGTATSPTTTPSAITGVVLAAGINATGYNFAEITTAASSASIAGVVFLDSDNNGVQGTGEPGLAGVVVQLSGTDASGNVVSRSTVTDANGNYAFTGLAAGTYAVLEPTQPPNTGNGATVAGSAGGTATGVGTLPSSITAIALAGGQASINNNFAEVPLVGSLTGRVWLDANGNGLIDAGEVGIAGVTIELTGTDVTGATVTRSTVTDANGNYAFANLSAGNYNVREPTQPPATTNGVTLAGSTGGTPSAITSLPSTITTIPVGAGQTSINNNFGELPASSIAGRVYLDVNNNGFDDSGEAGIAGVAVTLTGTDAGGSPVSIGTTTDANGRYVFPNLRPGNYTVTEPTQPAGTSNGITTAGTLNGVTTGTASAVSVLPSTIASIVLPIGGQSIANNFGEVGDAPNLLVTKATVEQRFTVNHVGNYTIRVRNGGQVATSGTYRVSDRLPAGLTLDATPTGTGWTCAGAAGATTFTCSASNVLAANTTSPNAIVATVRVGATAFAASPVDNAVLAEGGGESDPAAPTQAERDAFNGNVAGLPVCVPGITQNACRVPTTIQASASISGTVWYDIGNATGLLDGGDRRLSGWIVEVLDAAGNIVARGTTGADGTYRIDDLVPGVPLTVRFRDPQSGIVFGYPVNGEVAPGSSGVPCNQAAAIAAGTASSCVGTGNTPALTVVLAAGQNLTQQSLPVDPTGVVYDASLRQPVPGSIVTLAPVGTCTGWDPATSLVATGLGGYTIAGSAVSMTVDALGIYQFLFAPAAPASCTFGLTVTPPSGYRFVSTTIPPATGPLVPPGGRGATFPVQPQAAPPTGAVGPGTTYYLTFVSGSGGPNLINNHIPLDPSAPSGLSLSKTGDKQTVEVGDTIRYTITVVRNGGPVPPQITVVDRLPQGFTFINGTTIVNGTPIVDPAGKPGPRLAFNLGSIGASGQLVLQYRARVGVGSQQGDGVNRAIGYACTVTTGCVTAGSDAPVTGSISTNQAQYRVRITGGAFTTEACFAGKIFVDCNGNHIQDPEELGIPGVRLVLSDGTTLISDSEGKYSLCGLPPRSAVLRVDPHTLPTGSSLTTSSNRNLGDAGSLWLDLKNGELHRADFIEGSCSNTVVDQVKARRAQGEVRTVETEGRAPALRFESKAHGLDRTTSPKEGTDTADQPVPQVRDPSTSTQGGANVPR